MADDLIIYGGRGNSKPFVSINALKLLLENKELKAKVNILNREIKILKSNRLNMFEHLDIVQENNKLKQTLTEIKEIAQNVIKNVSDRCIETTPMYYIHKQILQKISECEGNDGL
ncbi:MAG: hypothetical protein J6V44_09170 [Methanobrevibacter sp.]|nr:hypothetical protein [Methanobrevibacter sp.]